MKSVTKEEIIELMKERDLTVEKVIDSIIDINGIIGVGLVTIAETLYIYTLYNKELRDPSLTKEEVLEIFHNRSKINFN